MRSSMGMKACLRSMSAAIAATWILAACSGGGSDGGAEFEVALKVDGVADTSNPMSVGEISSVTVPSGATLVFESTSDAAWTLAATGSSYDVRSESARSKSIVVTSNGGGGLSIVFANAATPSQTSTLNVVVEPKQFDRVAMTDGEVAHWANTVVLLSGSTLDSPYRHRSALIGSDGHYRQDSANDWTPDEFTYRYLFNADDRQTGYQDLVSGHTCTYSVPLADVTYPLYVGKTWSVIAQKTCNDTQEVRGTSTVSVVEAFEPVTVGAGTHDALRIRTETTYSGLPDSNVPGGTFTASETCWWAVDLGRQVKCEATMHYPVGTPDPKIASQTRTLVAFEH